MVWWILGIICVFAALLILGMCRAAGRYDDKIEVIYQTNQPDRCTCGEVFKQRHNWQGTYLFCEKCKIFRIEE